MDNGEIYTKQIQAGSRTYFFDIKKTEIGDLYFNITETRKTSSGYDRHRIIIFDEDVHNFVEAFKEIMAKYNELKKV
jgi:DNA transposition AAA+ family ATPase